MTIAGAYKVHKKEYEAKDYKVHKKGYEETLITKLIGDTLVPNKEAHKYLIDITKSNIRQVVL